MEKLHLTYLSEEAPKVFEFSSLAVPAVHATLQNEDMWPYCFVWLPNR